MAAALFPPPHGCRGPEINENGTLFIDVGPQRCFLSHYKWRLLLNPLKRLRRLTCKSSAKMAANKSGDVRKRGRSFISPSRFRQNKAQKPAASAISLHFFISTRLLSSGLHSPGLPLFTQLQCYFMNRLTRYAKFKFDRCVNSLTSTCIPDRGMLLYRCEVDHKQTYPFV